MGQDQNLGQQGACRSRQRMKRRRMTKPIPVQGRLLVAMWALGGDFYHPDNCRTVVFCGVHTVKLGRYRLDGWAVSWMRKWLDHQVQMIVVKGCVLNW